jgi:MFS family permease
VQDKLSGSLLLCLFAGLMGAFQFGWATGAINMPGNEIKSVLHLHHIMWPVVVGAFTIGGLVGAQMAGGLADRYGRKGFLVGLSVVFIVAGAFQVRGHLRVRGSFARAHAAARSRRAVVRRPFAARCWLPGLRL